MLGNTLVMAVDDATVQQLLAVFRLASPETMQAALPLAIQFGQQMLAGPAGDGERMGLPMQVVDNVAVVRLSGGIYKYKTRAVRDALRAASADGAIDSIVLAVNSPGGTVDGTDELAQEVAAITVSKPITTVVDGMVASAAYWIASQSSAIYATSRLNLVGSLGVRMMLNDFSQFFANNGIKAVPIDTGEFKSAGAFGTEVTQAQQDDFRRIVDGVLAEFKASVVAGRNLSPAATDALFTGQIWPAKDMSGKPDALSLGLIDGIQTLDATVQSLQRPVNRGRTTASAKARLALAAHGKLS